MNSPDVGRAAARQISSAECCRGGVEPGLERPVHIPASTTSTPQSRQTQNSWHLQRRSVLDATPRAPPDRSGLGTTHVRHGRHHRFDTHAPRDRGLPEKLRRHLGWLGDPDKPPDRGAEAVTGIIGGSRGWPRPECLLAPWRRVAGSRGSRDVCGSAWDMARGK